MALLTAMRRVASDVDHLQLIKRMAVDPKLDLVVVLGTEKSGATLGVLLQRSAQPNLIYKLAISKQEDGCELRVERATAKDLLLSCTPEKGNRGPNYEFVYDIGSKELIKQLEYAPFSFDRIIVSGPETVLIGSDTRSAVNVKYEPSDRLAFKVLKQAPARTEPKRFVPVRFGPEDRFILVQEGQTKHLDIVERTGKRYRLPQTSYDEFARLRPSTASTISPRRSATIDETIGPWQIVDNTLWFAKTFYDGEGNTGVGGFGYFDTERLKYRIYCPAEILDWSVTAMLVEPDAVWLALAGNGEYRTTSGGLLRFDRATEKMERMEFPDIVNEMARIGDDLLLATDSGAAVVRNHVVRRFILDQTTDGRPQMTEAEVGN